MSGWNESKTEQHINYLELKAVYFGLKALCEKCKHKHARIMTDNTAAVHNINNIGTIKSQICKDLVKDVWNWAIKREIWLLAAHIPGSQNIIADTEFIRKVSSAEWVLNREKYLQLTKFLKFDQNAR